MKTLTMCIRPHHLMQMVCFLLVFGLTACQEGPDALVNPVQDTEARLAVDGTTSMAVQETASVFAAGKRAATATKVPLLDMTHGETYLGFTGGLYPNGSNTMPSAHNTRGTQQGNAVEPLNTVGSPSSTGKIVMLSIGMSHTTQEFCNASTPNPNTQTCNDWSFAGQSADDNTVDKQSLVLANGAQGGQDATKWDASNEDNYDRIRDTILSPKGLTEKQVQVVWLKVANVKPIISLPSASADAYTLLSRLGNTVRALKVRYPNLKQVFLSSRSYGGYAVGSGNPEPYAYETGFAVKWLIEAQINQMSTGLIDSRAGDLNYNTVAPWLAWGPYFWADGTKPRSDGLTWVRADFESDGTHPSQSGEEKVADALMDFFKTSNHTRCWFLTSGACS
jgi:hypothetical protein